MIKAMVPIDENLISVAEAAGRLGLSEVRVRVLCREGRLDARRVGSVFVIDAASVDTFKAKPVGRPPKAPPTK